MKKIKLLFKCQECGYKFEMESFRIVDAWDCPKCYAIAQRVGMEF